MAWSDEAREAAAAARGKSGSAITVAHQAGVNKSRPWFDCRLVEAGSQSIHGRQFRRALAR